MTTYFDGNGVRFGNTAAQPQLYDMTASLSAGSLTVTLAPTSIAFKDADLKIGTPVTVTMSSSASIVTPQGATFGIFGGGEFKLWVLALNYAGTVELAICGPDYKPDETGRISTTAISSSSTLSTGRYSTTARTFVTFKVIGTITVAGLNNIVSIDTGEQVAWRRIVAAGTLNAATYLRGDGTWSTPTTSNIQGGAVGSVPYQTAVDTTGMLPVGTTGQVLTVAGGVPSWSTPATGGIGGIQVFTSSGTFTVPSGVSKVKMIVTGAGSNGAAGYGCCTWWYDGAAGGTAIKYIAVTPGNTLNVTVGTTSGAASSVSSGTQSISTVTATGGSTSGTSNGVSGGVGAGGDMNIRGGGSGHGAAGAASYWGGSGSIGVTPSAGAYGSGGGAPNSGSWPFGQGVVVFEW